LSTGGEPAASELPLAHALALGLLHGPAELLPISSSAHTALVPWLLGWPYGRLDARLRKSFEVALHAGTAVALLTRPPWGGGSRQHGSGRVDPIVLACAAAPPALAGYALGERIERRLGTPATIAVGLLAGAAAMGAAEVRGEGARTVAQAQARDGLALGLAQALALIPGVSRSGLAGAVARERGFARLQADRLCWQTGLPVIGGAAVLQAVRAARRGVRREHRRALALGGSAALLSTGLSVRLLGPRRRVGLSRAAVAYRLALAGVVIRRVRDNTERPTRLQADSP
jgi:undecaprenyl-diphosphatase